MIDIAHWCELPKHIKGCITTVDEPGNLAAHVGDDPATVVLHRRQLHRDLDTLTAPQWLQQVHGVQCVKLSSNRLPVSAMRADAAWTDQAQVPCAVLTADCLPILLWDRSGSAVAAVHAGWRGLAAGIIQQTMASLPAAGQNFIAFIGPAISQAAFEVGPEVRAVFTSQISDANRYFKTGRSALHFHADLAALAEAILYQCGIAKVIQSHLCTVHDARFYSYRKNPESGRLATLIWRSE